jgi:hypothetical protein
LAGFCHSIFPLSRYFIGCSIRKAARFPAHAHRAIDAVGDRVPGTVAWCKEACRMIQEDAARTNAFRQILEPLRALKGIISVVKLRRNRQVRALCEVALVMNGMSAVFAKSRMWTCLLAMLTFGIAFAPQPSAAQAAPGPQSGATPSDEPSSSAKGRATAPIGGHPNLSGNWTLNKDQSDDPREKMRDAMGGAGGGRGGGFGGGMGGGRRGGGGQGQGGGEGRQGNMLADFSQLWIEQTPTSAKVTGSSGRVLAIYSSADSSKSGGAGDSNSAGNSADSNNSDSSEGAGNQNAPAVANWQGSQLVAVNQARRGSMTRTYELSPEGNQLYVTTKVDNPRLQQPVTFRFVYDAATANGGGSQ